MRPILTPVSRNRGTALCASGHQFQD